MAVLVYTVQYNYYLFESILLYSGYILRDVSVFAD